MINVVVSGLPANTTLPKLVRNLKRMLRQQKFWIRDMSDVYGSDTKQASIEFPSMYEARDAAQYLNGLEFEFSGHKYPLLAEIEGQRHQSSSYQDQRSGNNFQDSRSYRDRYGGGFSREVDNYSRDRSRSPVRYHNEASKLDIEIELLRKQRQIIEEERKLLIERKKLQLIREYGPNAVQDLPYMEDDRGMRRHPPRYEDQGPPNRRPAPPQYRPRIEKPVFLPRFMNTWKAISKEMKEIIDQATSHTKTKDNLLQLLEATVRKRLAFVLEGRPRLATSAIIRVYRAKHPKSTDADLIEETLATISKGYFSDDDDTVDEKEVQKNRKKDQSGTTKSNSVVERGRPIKVQGPSKTKIKEDRTADQTKGKQDTTPAVQLPPVVVLKTGTEEEWPE